MHWVFLALGVVTLALVAGGALLVVAAASALDSDKDLEDFASPAEARAFASAHLPAPLPSAATVESLHYERFTDWRLTARVRLPSSEAVDQYLDRAKRERQLDDAYCGGEEPSQGARFFLRDVSACGSVTRGALAVNLDVVCYTR